MTKTCRLGRAIALAEPLCKEKTQQTLKHPGNVGVHSSTQPTLKDLSVNQLTAVTGDKSSILLVIEFDRSRLCHLTNSNDGVADQLLQERYTA
jgi:hypothetical protein